MRKLIFSMTRSLDGYSKDRRGPRVGGAQRELHRFHNQKTSELGLHLLGRNLYEVMKYWETAEDRSVRFRLLARVRADLEAAAEDRLLADARDRRQYAPLARRSGRRGPGPEGEDGADIAVGGATLASTLTKAGLIDEYHVFESPVVLGPASRSSRAIGIDLELLETRTFGSGVVFLRYGRVTT